MQLHRTSGRPDWDSIAPRGRNRWQRFAAATNGIVTPANMLSLAGLVLVVIGLGVLAGQHYIAGVLLVITGRLADIADGMAAEKTGTKSPLGEAVDATLDKIEALLALIVCAAAHIAPLWVVLAIGVQNALNAALSFVARRRGSAIHPSRAGKVSTAGQWAVLAAYVLAAGTGGIWHIPAVILTASTVGLGLYATAGYARSAYARPVTRL